MNAIELFRRRAKEHPDKMAITDLRYGALSFADLSHLSAQAQALLKRHKIGFGDSVLVAVTPSPLLYGLICALLGLGVRIVFIEPWLGLERIQEVVRSTRPRAFLSNFFGRLWGLRSSAVRDVPLWLSVEDIVYERTRETFAVIDVAPEHEAFVVFSSGTTGTPKGVIRSHRYMQNVYDVFTALEPQNFTTPDLIIFPNVVLFHLATGRGSVIVPQRWTPKNLRATIDICQRYRPQTLSTGPAFLKALMDQALLRDCGFIERFVIGGALTDCWLLEKAFEELPASRFVHIYGGSEAEPVAVSDARESVRRSRERGFFQTLHLGEVIPQLSFKTKDEVLWVAGPNVSGEYVGDSSLNEGIKERDLQGTLWHNMGDRVEVNGRELWYMGREKQRKDDFLLEQQLYQECGTSKLFLHRTGQGLHLIGSDSHRYRELLEKAYPEIIRFHERSIVRDKRHRSRIDRIRSLPPYLRMKL